MNKIVFLFIIFLPNIASSQVLHKEQSQYSQILIEEKKSIRCLKFQASTHNVKHYQGCINTQNDTMVFNYSKALMVSLFVRPDPQKVLVIGLGAGIFPKALHTLNPNIVIDSVEIDPVVERIAHEYFNYPNSKNLNTIIQDGRVFVNEAVNLGKQYDLIVLDAFNSDYIPEHLMTFEFLEDLKGLLSDGGVIASNTFSKSRLYDHESATYKAVFGRFYNIELDGQRANRVIIGTANGLISNDEIQANAKAYEPLFKEIFGIDTFNVLSHMNTSANWDENAKVLTDNYSPSNALLGQNAIDYDLVNSFKAEYKDKFENNPVIGVVSIIGFMSAFLWIMTIIFESLTASQ